MKHKWVLVAYLYGFILLLSQTNFLDYFNSLYVKPVPELATFQVKPNEFWWILLLVGLVICLGSVSGVNWSSHSYTSPSYSSFERLDASPKISVSKVEKVEKRCSHCGAPLNQSLEVCEYCGTPR